MSQHDLNVANQSRTNFRQDLNNALEAIASQQSGPGDPAIIYPFQTKINTSATPAVMYIRNAANTAWVRYGYINASTGQLILDNATDADTLDGVHLAALLQKSGGNMTGAINEAADTIAAHATACDIWSKPNNITLTGDVVTFTDLADAPQAGATRWIKSNAAHVLTNNANLIVQGGANVTLANGDWLRVEAITTTTFNILVFRAEGTALVATVDAGQIIQVVGGWTGGTFSSTAEADFEDITILSNTITPKYPNSKFILMANFTLGQVGCANAICHFRFTRNGTPICIGDAYESRNRTTVGAVRAGGYESLGQIHLLGDDTPSTGSEITYKVQGKKEAAGTAWRIGYSEHDVNNADIGNRSGVCFIVMEVKQ